MTTTAKDTRPPAGWDLTYPERVTFVEHDASFFAEAPAREGYAPTFVARFGVGPGAFTRWIYRQVAS